MLPNARGKKSEGLTYGLRSRLTASIMGKNSENSLPGLNNKKNHLRLLEVTSHNDLPRNLQAKRKTAVSPQGPVVKRTAFSDVTNAIQHLHIPGTTNEVNKPEKVTTTKGKLISSRGNFKVTKKSQPPVIPEDIPEDENATLYMSALDEVIEPILQTQSQPEAEAPAPIAVPRGQPRSSSEPPVPIVASSKEPTASSTSEKKSNLTELVNFSSAVPSPSVSFKSALSPFPAWQLQSPNVPPPGVQDFDSETSEDCNAVADYAPFIFCYLRSREPLYKVRCDFLSQHEMLTNEIRAICVDWMVDVQETLELNHETLYLGVKNLDLFLSNPKPCNRKNRTPALPIKPSKIRLLACASLLLAAQYDERLPPPAEDWLQMCDRDYTVSELNTMQQQLFCALNFDLGAPLSYRFLRRYARACGVDMDLLTLARYILESSLLDSQFSPESDSMMAAAALWLAMCMQARLDTSELRFALWTPALQHYTGYKIQEIYQLTVRLNAWIRSLPTRHLRTVYSKYSHRVFRKVALIPTLEEL